MCFLDQSLAEDGISCGQCPLGAYGLTAQSKECHSCAYLFGTVLGAEQQSKLQFLCDNKIGQISSDNRGVYLASEYPSQRQFSDEWRQIAI